MPPAYGPGPGAASSEAYGPAGQPTPRQTRRSVHRTGAEKLTPADACGLRHALAPESWLAPEPASCAERCGKPTADSTTAGRILPTSWLVRTAKLRSWLNRTCAGPRSVVRHCRMTETSLPATGAARARRQGPRSGLVVSGHTLLRRRPQASAACGSCCAGQKARAFLLRGVHALFATEPQPVASPPTKRDVQVAHPGALGLVTIATRVSRGSRPCSNPSRMPAVRQLASPRR